MGIILPVTNNDLGTLVAPVIKRDGPGRLRGDYIVLLKPRLHPVENETLNIGELEADRSAGKFSEIHTLSSRANRLAKRSNWPTAMTSTRYQQAYETVRGEQGEQV